MTNNINFRQRLDEFKHGHRVQGKLRVAASEGIVGAAANFCVNAVSLRMSPLIRATSWLIRKLVSDLSIPASQRQNYIGLLDF